MSEMKYGGSRVSIRCPDGNTISLSVPGGLQCSYNPAEILAICTAAEHLLECGKQMGNIAIFTDSLSTLLPPSPSPILQSGWPLGHHCRFYNQLPPLLAVLNFPHYDVPFKASPLFDVVFPSFLLSASLSPSLYCQPYMLSLNWVDANQMIQGLHSSLVKQTAKFPVSLQWVLAHRGLTGNETADWLAKFGSQSLQT